MPNCSFLCERKAWLVVCSESSDTLSSESRKQVEETPTEFRGDSELRSQNLNISWGLPTSLAYRYCQIQIPLTGSAH